MGRYLGNYLILDTIGRGAYGTVCKAQDRLTGEFVAIKIVSTTKLSANPKLLDYLDQEIQILTKIKHPNIVNLLEEIRTKEKTYLVMEYCRGGDFDHYLKKKKRLTEDQARFFLQQLARALEFMRINRVIHRDLKPGNILLATEGDEPQLKVADFGYARYIDPQDLAQTHLGTPLYMAPEVFAPPHQYDAKADLWSVGCILYEMLVGRVPFIAQSQMALFQLIDTTPVTFPKDVQLSDTCKDLILKLLKKDRMERITFEEFFLHPFLDLQQQASPTSSKKLPTPLSPEESLEHIMRASANSDNSKVAEALSALNIVSTSPDKNTPATEGEPSFFSNTVRSADSGSGTLSTSGSLSRPKMNPYKALGAESEEGYIMVNSAHMEVNAIADVLKRAPIVQAPVPQQIPPSIFSQVSISPPLQSSSPPLPSASPSSSPTVGSALSRALASTAAKFIWPASPITTPEEVSARDILVSLDSLSRSASTNDERAIWHRINASARQAYAVVDLAQLRLADQTLETEGDRDYFGYILYLKALSLIRVAMMNAKSFWLLKDQTITHEINRVVQFLRDRFNECLDNADRLNTKLKNTKYQAVVSTNKVFVDQAKLLFERARELGREAGIEEVVGNNAISERCYANALLLFKVLISKDLPEQEILNDSDRRIIENYASSTLRRMQQIQKKLPSASSGSPPF